MIRELLGEAPDDIEIQSHYLLGPHRIHIFVGDDLVGLGDACPDDEGYVESERVEPEEAGEIVIIGKIRCNNAECGLWAPLVVNDAGDVRADYPWTVIPSSK